MNAEIQAKLSALTKENDALRQQLTKLNTNAISLNESNSALCEIAYAASHDLQEPLRKIVTLSDRLSVKYKNNVDDKGQDYINRIQKASVRMSTLIDDLLTFSTLATGQQPLKKLDIQALMPEIIQALKLKIKTTGAVITFSDLPQIEAEPAQIQKLLYELISNAIKFRRNGITPVITIQGRTMPNHSEIEVQDNGIGFDEQYTEKIFGLFQKLHGKNRYDGNGSGLAFCRKIVQRHGGEISAKAGTHNGASFTVKLPLSHFKKTPQQMDNP